jgi:transposase
VIVAESLVAGAKVSEVAARHGVNANMLSAWRGQVSAGGMTRGGPKSAPISSAVTFAPVKVVAAGPQSDARADLRPAAGAVEIVLGDASIRVVKGVDTATLSRVLAAVRGPGLIATRAGLRVWVATQPIDFRRGVHGMY